jgi:hypothetical protein
MRWLAFTLMLPFVFAAGMGCSRRQVTAAAGKPPAPVQEVTAPPGTFDRSALGVRLDWPAGWVQRPSKDFVLLLTHPDAEQPSLSLDVPNLPPHVPGLIPIGSVRNGYLDDLRKAAGAIKTTNLTPPAIPAAAMRFVRSTWTDSGGQAWQETALLMVHADRVYIVRARSSASDEPAVRAAFDEVVGSLKWTK